MRPPRAGCAIFTTSGTTKAPKFVLHDQRTVIRHAFDVVKGFSIDSASTVLLAPPLCGVFGFCSAMAALDAAAVIAHVASRLARYKVPRHVLAVDAFPVTPGANATKIQRGKLRELAEALLH